MRPKNPLTETFRLIDGFCRQFEPAWHKRLLQTGAKKSRRRSELGLAELPTLTVLADHLVHAQKAGVLPVAADGGRMGVTPVPGQDRSAQVPGRSRWVGALGLR